MRGQATLTLPEVFIAAIGFGLVFLSILYAVTSIASEEASRKQLFVTGLALDIQALPSVGEDISVQKNTNSPYKLFLQGTEVYIQEDMKTNRFVFAQPPGFVFQGGEYKPGAISLFKTAKQFGVAQTDKVRPYLLTCDSPVGKKLSTIALDPGHGYDEAKKTGSKGEDIISAGITESEYTLQLANRMKTAGKVTLTRGETEASTGERQKTPGDALISLHAGAYSDNKDLVKAYYNNQPGSKRLACEILNSITTSLNVPVRLIPANLEYASPEDSQQILSGTRPSVLLEIGNAKNKDSILNKIPELRSAILEGIQNYE